MPGWSLKIVGQSITAPFLSPTGPCTPKKVAIRGRGSLEDVNIHWASRLPGSENSAYRLGGSEVPDVSDVKP